MMLIIQMPPFYTTSCCIAPEEKEDAEAHTGTASLIDSEVQCILNEGRASACELLTEHYAQLAGLAQDLLADSP